MAVLRLRKPKASRDEMIPEERSARRCGETIPEQVAGILAAVLLAACFEGAPSAPSDPKRQVEVAGAVFTVTSAALTRDFMPIVLNPGPDGGRPLTGFVGIRALGGGNDRRFNATAHVFDKEGKAHQVATVVQLQGELTVWDGSLPARETRELEVLLSGGPYLPAGSEAAIVVEWTAQNGDKGSLRITDVEVKATY